MSKYHLEKGVRYRADFHLSFFERIASDDGIAAEVASHGFEDVRVYGSGADRWGEGTWGRDNQDVDLPGEITSVRRL